jgi:hypothetical protein
LNIQDKLWIACTDKQSFDTFKTENKILYRIDGLSEHHNYGTESFNKFVMSKIKIIREALSRCDRLVYVDADIYFFKDPTGLLDYIFDSCPFFMQKDYPGTSVCSGFLGMTNTPKNISVLDDTIYAMKNKTGKDDWNDQNYISSELFKRRYLPYQLPMHLFPNGHYAFIDKQPLDQAFIVHANYIIGKEEKIKKLKEINAYAL